MSLRGIRKYYFVYIIALTSNQVLAQSSEFNKTILSLEDSLVQRRSRYIISHIDSMLITVGSFSTEQKNILRTYKLEALVNKERLEEAKELSIYLLDTSSLPLNYKPRVWIQQSFINEIVHNINESFSDLAKAENYYLVNLRDRYYGVMLYRKSSLQRIRGEKKKAIDLAQQAKAFGLQHDYKHVVATAYLLLGLLYDKNNYNIALQNNDSASKYFVVVKDYDGASSSILNSYRLYRLQNNRPAAKQAILSALHIQETYGKDSTVFENVYGQLGYFYEEQGRQDSALYYTRRASVISAYNTQGKNALALQQLEAKQEKIRRQYNVERYATDLRRVQKEKELIAAIMLSLFALLTITIFFLLNLRRRNAKISHQRNQIQVANENLIASVSEKELLLKELNHRVKNNLSLILSLTRFHAEDANSIKAKENLEDLENRIRAIAITHEHFSYTDVLNVNSTVQLKIYIDKIVSTLLMISTRKIVYELDIENILVNMDTVLPIGILTNELVSNTIKHGVSEEAIKIKITAGSKGGLLEITYVDSGIKFGTSSKKDSMGIFIIDSMVQQLEGTCSREGSAYYFTLHFKY